LYFALELFPLFSDLGIQRTSNQDTPVARSLDHTCQQAQIFDGECSTGFGFL
jgi:hypothetical protein